MTTTSRAVCANRISMIRKVKGFAERSGYDHVIVGNKFAFRSTDIGGLRTAADPVGPENDQHIEQILRDATFHVVAWGTLGKIPDTLRSRWKEIVRIADRVGCELHCIGTNADKHPKHPLMTGYYVPIAPWPVPWFAGRRIPVAVGGS